MYDSTLNFQNIRALRSKVLQPEFHWHLGKHKTKNVSGESFVKGGNILPKPRISSVKTPGSDSIRHHSSLMMTTFAIDQIQLNNVGGIFVDYETLGTKVSREIEKEWRNLEMRQNNKPRIP